MKNKEGSVLLPFFHREVRSMEKKPTRKEQAQMTKRNIYQAAISLIESKGYENVSIEDITNRANTAKGTFYLYFKSKQDLIYHTIAMYDEIAKNSYEKAKEFRTFEEQLVHYLIYANTEILVIGEKILTALLGHNLNAKEKFVTVEGREIYLALGQMIERGYETGELSRMQEKQFYMEMIVIFIQGLDYYWCNATETFDYIKATQIQARIFAKGMIALYGVE